LESAENKNNRISAKIKEIDLIIQKEPTLKKIFFAILAALTFFAMTNLIAQDSTGGEKSKFFVKTVPITTIYPHQLGYKVQYVKNGIDLMTFYIPIGWFSLEEQKAQIVWGDDPSYPYFSIFWKDGKFDHIRLYVKREKSDVTWGQIYDAPGLKDKFASPEIPTEF
jgi:hypothetical protein